MIWAVVTRIIFVSILYTVFQKKIADRNRSLNFSCDLSRHHLILVIFGRSVNWESSNQKLIYFPTSPSIVYDPL